MARPTSKTEWGLPIAVLGGLVAGWAIGKVAEIWTSDRYSPVKKIAAQAETGPATTVLSGISAGMMSVAASVILIGAGVLVAYWGGQQTLGDNEFAGIYGIAVAAIGMLATTGVVVSVDAYGPIADNAGGIAEMAELDPSVREVTDALDSLGNTTAAIAKGFAVGSAALTALALFKTFEVALQQEDPNFVLSLDVGEVDVFIGLFLGAMLPFLFAALTIDAVGRAANKMIEEVRRQFREIPGLREGLPGVVPDSEKCCCHKHAGFAAGDAPTRFAGDSSPVDARLHRRRHAWWLLGRCSGDGIRPCHLHGQRRWCVGQRQEVHRGRPSRWQRLRSAQGCSGGRHCRRSFQGHGRPRR